MQPINKQERTKAMIKFLAMNLLVVGLVSYAIYSYVFVKEKITTEVKVDTNEVVALEHFMIKADGFIKEFNEADTDTDRAKYSLELNRLIIDEKDKFSTNSKVFDLMSESYKSALRNSELVVKMGSTGDASCAEKMKGLEEKIEDFKLEIRDLESDLKDLEGKQGETKNETRRVKRTLERISNDLVNVADDINAMDWCKGLASGGGKKEIKSELKQRLSGLRNDLLQQAGEL